MDQLQYRIRRGKELDFPFVFNSFLKSYKTYNPLAKIAENGPYYSIYHKQLEKHLVEGELDIACLADDPEAILGWALTIPHKPNRQIVYTYIKSLYRSQGIASSLLEPQVKDKEGVGYLYSTQPGEKLLKALSVQYDVAFYFVT